MKSIAFLALSAIILSLSTSAKAELIVLASPPTLQDSYYDDVAEDIFDFHISFAREIIKHGDEVLILANEDFYDDYVAKLGEDKVLLAPMLDIWMRDFTVLNTVKPVMFRYSAAGQGGSQVDSDVVQEEFAAFLEDAGLVFAETDLINDGGNYVDDGKGNVVISKKFLRDNRLRADEARKQISRLAGVTNIAFIEADEQGGLEHADGVVSFIDENTLIVNAYPDNRAYSKQLEADLRAGLPGVEIHEIVAPYDGSDIYDDRFGSACGLYTNALVTPDRIYLPQFGIPEDEIALRQIRAVTTKEVVPVLSRGVCPMGGGVRCMSLQLRGSDAHHLLRYVKAQNRASY